MILKGHSSGIVSIATSFKDNIISAGDKSIIVWSMKTGQQVKTLRQHTKPVGSVCISDDGSKIVSCSWDKTIRIWKPVD